MSECTRVYPPVNTLNVITPLFYLSWSVSKRSLSFRFVICVDRQARKNEVLLRDDENNLGAGGGGGGGGGVGVFGGMDFTATIRHTGGIVYVIKYEH